MLVIHRRKNDYISIINKEKNKAYDIRVGNYNKINSIVEITVNKEDVIMNLNTDDCVHAIEDDVLIVLFSVDNGVKLGVKADRSWKIIF